MAKRPHISYKTIRRCALARIADSQSLALPRRPDLADEAAPTIEPMDLVEGGRLKFGRIAAKPQIDGDTRHAAHRYLAYLAGGVAVGMAAECPYDMLLPIERAAHSFMG